MNNIESKETFTNADYSHSFQTKIFTLLLNDRVYLEQIQEILDNDYFDTDASKWLITLIKNHFKEYKVPPSVDVIKKELSAINSQTLRDGALELIKAVFIAKDDDDLPYVKNESLDFCVNQNLRNAILSSVDALGKRDYDGIRKLIDNALKTGMDRNVGHIYKILLDQRMSDAARACIPTPWDVINEITQGGSAGGDLFVMVAPAGIGKTWGLVNVGAHAIKKGKTVIHYTMELNENYVGRRYDAHLSGIASQNLKYHKEDIQSSISGIEGNLIIKYYPPKAATGSTLRAHIDKCILQGFKPDLIIVDYADLLRSLGTGMRMEVRHSLENIYEDLRAMAGEYNIPIWTASQANRSSLENDIIGAEKIAEAYSKVMVADFVISLSRKVEDKIAGTGRWHVIKNRFGRDGLTFPSKMNTTNGFIQINEENSVLGKEAREEMGKGPEYVRQLIKKRHSDLMDKTEDEDNSISGFEET